MPEVGRARLGCGLAVCLALLAWAPAAFAAPDGVQRLKYKIGPFKIIPGQNEIDYAPIVERPQVDGYITRIRPDLDLHQRQGPGRRRHPPAPRRVAQHVAAGRDPTPPRALRRRRGGEDDRRSPEGLRLPLRDRGPLAPQPHDPQPHAGGDRGLHGLRDRLRAGDLTCGEAHPTHAPGVDGRDERQPVPGLRRREGRRAAEAATPSRTTNPARTAADRSATSGRSIATAC